MEFKNFFAKAFISAKGLMGHIVNQLTRESTSGEEYEGTTTPNKDTVSGAEQTADQTREIKQANKNASLDTSLISISDEEDQTESKHNETHGDRKAKAIASQPKKVSKTSLDISEQTSKQGNGHHTSTTSEEDLEEDLEELVYEPQAPDSKVIIGSVCELGGVQYRAEADLPRGYYLGISEVDGISKENVFHKGQIAGLDLWSKLATGTRHPRLPVIVYSDVDGTVLEKFEGKPIQVGIAVEEAVNALYGIAQLMQSLATQGWIVYGIETTGLILNKNDGIKLQYLPLVVPVGTPIDSIDVGGNRVVIGEEEVTASEQCSLFLWGALLYELTSGKRFPAEGVMSVWTLDIKQESGLPQLLNAALFQTNDCTDLSSLLELCRKCQWSPVPLHQYQIGVATTVGLNPTRICNEDSYGINQVILESYNLHQQLIRACVADGMGGEANGELASQAAIETFCKEVPPLMDEPDIQANWTRALGWKANEAVMDALGATKGGCTLTGIVVVGERLTMAHVGDSRAYLYSPKRGLQQLSRDHSRVQAMLDNGNMTEDEAVSSPYRNQILRALGPSHQNDQQDNFIDILSSRTDQEGTPLFHQPWLSLHRGDMVLLLSDGVWGAWEYRNHIIAENIQNVIEEANFDPQQIVNALIDCALKAGADDNATAVVVKRTL